MQMQILLKLHLNAFKCKSICICLVVCGYPRNHYMKMACSIVGKQFGVSSLLCVDVDSHVRLVLLKSICGAYDYVMLG